MSKPVTEFCTLPLNPGADVSNPNSEGQVWQDTLATLAEQPGAQNMYWGTRIEEPGRLDWFIDWETLKHHNDFTKTDGYGPFVKNIMKILDSGPSFHHAPLTPHPAVNVLSNTQSPCTEVVTLYFPTDLSESDHKTITDNMKKAPDVLSADADGYRSLAYGWIIEELPNDKASGGKAKGLKLLIGWDSREKHLEYRETQSFKEKMAPLIRGAPNLVDINVYHVSLNLEQSEGVVRGNPVPIQEEELNPQVPNMDKS